MKSTSFFILFVLTASLGFAQNTSLESFGLKGPVSVVYEISYDKSKYDNNICPSFQLYMKGYFFNKSGQLSIQTEHSSRRKYFYNSQGVCDKIKYYPNKRHHSTKFYLSEPPNRYYKEHVKKINPYHSFTYSPLKHTFIHIKEMLSGYNIYGYERVDSLDRVIESAKFKLKNKDLKEKHHTYNWQSFDNNSIENTSYADTFQNQNHKRTNTIIRTDNNNNWVEYAEQIDRGLNGKSETLHFRLIDYDLNSIDNYPRKSLLKYFGFNPYIPFSILEKSRIQFSRYRSTQFLREQCDFKKIESEIKPENIKEARKCKFKSSPNLIFSLNWEAIKRDSVEAFKNSAQLIKYLEFGKVFYNDVYYQGAWLMGVTIDKSESKSIIEYEYIQNNDQQRLVSTIGKNKYSWFLFRLKSDWFCYFKGIDIMCATIDSTDDQTLIYRPLVDLVNEYLKTK